MTRNSSLFRSAVLPEGGAVYLRAIGMAPAEPPPPAPDRPAVDPGASAVRPVGEPERYGPLELQRYVKADGRRLVIYARADDEAFVPEGNRP